MGCKRLWWAGVAVAAVHGTASGQPGGDGGSEGEAGAPVLAGPTVEAEATPVSLVRLGYDGRIERVADAQPEVAALSLIELDAGALGRIEARLEERAAFLDRAVTEHYRTLLELYSAFGAGDEAEVMRLYLEFASHLQPLFAGGGLARQLAGEMEPAARAEYARVLREYYGAVARDMLAHPEEAQGKAPESAAEAIRQYKVGLLMEEVGRSFARIIEQKTQEFEEALAAIRMTPEREAEVRSMVEVFAQEVGLNPTEAQKREIFTRLMEILTPAERQRLLGWVLR